MTGAGHLAIGDVLQELREEFDDITISKIRFLESQGLIAPERTPSGYRKFAPADVERLRWILAQQRDHFLPLKVIKDRLEELDQSQLSLDDLDEVRRPAKKAAVEKFFESARSGGGFADTTVTFDDDGDRRATSLGDATGVSMTRAELAAAANLDDAQLAELETYGLVEPIESGSDRPLFDEGALVVAQAASKFMRYGI